MTPGLTVSVKWQIESYTQAVDAIAPKATKITFKPPVKIGWEILSSDSVFAGSLSHPIKMAMGEVRKLRIKATDVFVCPVSMVIVCNMCPVEIEPVELEFETGGFLVPSSSFYLTAIEPGSAQIFFTVNAEALMFVGLPLPFNVIVKSPDAGIITVPQKFEVENRKKSKDFVIELNRAPSSGDLIITINTGSFEVTPSNEVLFTQKALGSGTS